MRDFGPARVLPSRSGNHPNLVPPESGVKGLWGVRLKNSQITALERFRGVVIGTCSGRGYPARSSPAKREGGGWRHKKPVLREHGCVGCVVDDQVAKRFVSAVAELAHASHRTEETETGESCRGNWHECDCGEAVEDEAVVWITGL